MFRPTEENYRPGNRIRDITDGDAYRSRYKVAWDSCGANPDDVILSLVLNTDGLVVNESGAQSAWPVFATVCELTPKKRFSRDKILNLALWQGEGKPPIDSITRIVQAEIDQINVQGACCSTSSGMFFSGISLAS